MERSTFERRQFVFSQFPKIEWDGPPLAICLHRCGNPRPYTVANALAYLNRSRSASVHYFISKEGVVHQATPVGQHAWHVSASTEAAKRGWPTVLDGLAKPRGDVQVVGIEHQQIPDAPPEKVGLQAFSQETRISSLLLARDLVEEYGPLEIVEHADLDKGGSRDDDCGDALFVPDYRADLADLIQGREPWRTVGETANGRPHPGPAPESPGPTVTTATLAEEQIRQAVRVSLLEERLDSIQTAQESLRDALRAWLDS